MKRSLRDESFDGVFHLASAVSGECEADFDLGLRSNIDSTRALLDALRANVNAGGKAARLVFSSSVAVFGPDPAVPLPARAKRRPTSRTRRWWAFTPTRRSSPR